MFGLEFEVLGADILAVQWVWPVGKPLVDSLGDGLWEISSSLADRIARVFFIIHDQEIVLLHGIIKRSRTAPKQELDLARKRQSTYLLAPPSKPLTHSPGQHETKNTSKSPPRK